MCEATLGTSSRASPTQSGSYPESALKPSADHPISPGALVSRPLADQHSPQDVKKSLTTFEDPLGLGLETLPTTGHADKMVKRGERKIKLGSLLHSDKLVSHSASVLLFAFDSGVEFDGLMSRQLREIATTRSDPPRQI